MSRLSLRSDKEMAVFDRAYKAGRVEGRIRRHLGWHALTPNDQMVKGAAFIDSEPETRSWPLSDLLDLINTWVAGTTDETETADCDSCPCSWCGACLSCGDFHFYSGRGCTTDICPLL